MGRDFPNGYIRSALAFSYTNFKRNKGEKFMSDVKKKYNVSVKGTMNIESNGRIIMSIEDMGDIPLDRILDDFDGREIKLAVNYDEDYEDSYVSVDPETGEVI